MSISFSGLASGLDTSSWIKSLTALKQAKVTVLQEEREQVLFQKDTLASVKSFFASFRSTVEKITNAKFNIAQMDLFAQNLAVSSDLKIFTATATEEAKEGSYEIKVDKLATKTKAVSRYNYLTTTIDTKTAVDESLLINLSYDEGGVKKFVQTGSIGVTVNGIERGIEITSSDTMETFTQKLRDVGIEANYNKSTGVFTANISAGDVNDIDGTGIAQALHLAGVNEGYTSNQLQYETVETVWDAADGATKMSALGVNAGTITIVANGASYDFTVNANTTMQDFLDFLSSKDITAGLTEDGVFSIEDAEITNDGTTGLINAFGLGGGEIYSNSQKSNALTYNTTILETTTADLGTKLADIGDGLTVTNGMNVVVKNSSNETHTIALNANSTIGDLLTGMNNAGLSAEMKPDGSIEISGGTITGGSFDAISALGLNSEPFTAMASGNALTETIEVYELVTLQTRLVDDMGVKEGYLSVTDSEGRQQYLKIYSGQTIADLMTDLANYGIYSDLDESTGILTITGGDFATMTDTDVLAKIADGSIVETDARYKHGTDLLTALYGATSISVEQTAVSQTYARSRALTYETLHTIDASLTTTLGQLGLAANGNATFAVRGETRTVSVTKDMTVEGLMNALAAAGIESSFSEEHSKIRIENATITSSTAAGTLGGVLGLTTEVSGKYVTSDALHAKVTNIIQATTATDLSDLGITSNQSILLYDDAGLNRTINVTPTTTIQDLMNAINASGSVTATFDDGVLRLKGGYIVNSDVETALGLERTSTEYSHALGSKMVITTEFANETTELRELGCGVDTIYIKGANAQTIATITTSEDMTIGELFSALAAYDISCTIKDGIMSFTSPSDIFITDNGTATNSVLDKLGIGSSTSRTETVVTTEAVLQTSSAIVSKTYAADGSTTLKELGYTTLQTLTVQGYDNKILGTISVDVTDTLNDMLTALAGYEISGTINNGVITLTSDDKKYVTGDLATSLGIGISTTIVTTTTAGCTNTSSGEIKVTSTIYADGSTTLGQLGYTSTQTIVVNDETGAIGTISVDTTDTLNDMLTALAGYEISGTINNGVITLTSDDKKYVTGTFVQNSLGITTSTSTTTTYSGVTIVSSGTISRTTTYAANGDTTLEELGANASQVFTISNAVTGAIDTITILQTATLNDMLTAFAGYGISGTINNSGQIRLYSENHNYVTGTFASSTLGLSTVTTSSTTTIVTGTTKASTNAISKTVTITADASTKLGDIGLSGTLVTTVIATGSQSNESFTTTGDMTVGDLCGVLSGYGFDAYMSGGVMYVSHPAGYTLLGGVAKELELGATNTGTYTVGTTATGTTKVYTTTVVTTTLSNSTEEVVYTIVQTVTTVTTQDVERTTQVVVNHNHPCQTITESTVDIVVSDTFVITEPTVGTATVPISYTYSVPITTTVTKTVELSATIDVEKLEPSTTVTTTKTTITLTTTKPVSTTIYHGPDRLNDGVFTNLVYEIQVTKNYNSSNPIKDTVTISLTASSTNPYPITAIENGSAAQINGQGLCGYNDYTQLFTMYYQGGSNSPGYLVFIPKDGCRVNVRLISQSLANSTYKESATSPEKQWSVQWLETGNGELLDVFGNDTDIQNAAGFKVWVETRGPDGTTVEVIGTTVKTVTTTTTVYNTITEPSVISSETEIVITQVTGWTKKTGTTSVVVDDVSTKPRTIIVTDTITVPTYTVTNTTHVWTTTETITYMDKQPVVSYTTKTTTVTDKVEKTTWTITTTNPTRTADGNTKFEDLGMTITTVATVYSDGKLYTVKVEKTDSIDDFLTSLAGFGIHGSIEGGKVTLKGDSEAYIASMATVLRTALGYTASTLFSTTGRIVQQASTVTQTYTSTNALTTDDTFASWGVSATQYVTVKSDGVTYTITVEANDTVDDLISTLAGYGIAASVTGSKMVIQTDENGYITGITKSLANALQISETGYYSTTVKTNLMNQTGATKLISTTNILSTDDTFASLGLGANGTITVSSSGVTHNITVKTSDTVDDLISTLAGHGIAGSVTGGKIKLIGDDEAYITGISSNLATFLKIPTGGNSYYKTVTHTTTSNDTSNTLKYSTTNSMTSEDVLSDLGLGAGTYTINVTSDGVQYNVIVESSDTVDDLISTLAGYGIVGSVSGGKITFKGDSEACITGMTGALANFLKVNGQTFYTTTLHTTKANDTSDAKSIVNTMTSDDTFAQMGLTSNGSIVVNSDGHLYTVSVKTTDTIDDLISTLAGYGIVGSISGGKISLDGDTEAFITGISQGVADVLKLTRTAGNYWTTSTVTTTFYTNDTSNTLTCNSIMTDETTLSELEITAGNIVIHKDGALHTVSIANTATIADLREILATYNITSEILDGKLSLNADGVVWLSDASGNIVNKLGLDYGKWQLGQFAQESGELTDTETIVVEATMDRKISELTTEGGAALGVSNGSIYVYKDGTRHLVNINVDDTLETLASKLSQYGITMGIDQDGKLYFQGENDSYLTTDGIGSGASNILTKFNVSNNWQTTYDSTSQKLDYEITQDSRITGDTKLTELQDSSGNSLGITEGEYTVVSNGVRTVETITADTTVSDFVSTMKRYGMVAKVDSDGAITVGGQHESYLLTSNTSGYDTNAIATLFAEWKLTNIYTSNNIAIPEDVTVAISETTKLADINEGANYVDGYITVVKDGVQTHISLTADDTVGTLINELELYGFQAVVNDSGQVILKNTGNSVLQNYVGAEKASNILDILGLGVAEWVSTSAYDGEPINVNEYTTTTAAATEDTTLADLGVTTGEYYIYKDGVKYTALISSDETIKSLMKTLATYGIETNIVQNGGSSVIEITGKGNTYIAKSVSTTNSSNITEKLFPTANMVTRYSYEGTIGTTALATVGHNATEETLISDLDNVAWTNATNKAEGGIGVTIDGIESVINITENETIGTLLEKFRALGLEATLSNGEIMIQSGYKEFAINNATTTSNAVNDLGLAFHNDLGGYVASTEECQSTTTIIQDNTDSIASWADTATKLNQLNITGGTFTVFRDGLRATVELAEDDTFATLQTKINDVLTSKGAVADVQVSFDEGYLKIGSVSGAKVEVGSTSDSSNIASICGFSNDGSGIVSSSRELYKINGQTKLMESGVFRLGNVTEGAFTIGDETFYVDDTTTLQGIMAQINASEKANTTAYWDSIEGKLVLTSRAEGSSFINIEAGSLDDAYTGAVSNLTDILCLTKTENLGAANQVTRIDVDNQEVGQNAVFSINGTTYTSTSNTITSDLSKIVGVTINLKGVNEDGGTTTLTVEKDKETVANAVSDIVDAYNELIENVDKEIAKGGTLDDQFSLKLLRNEIRSLMTNTFVGSTVFKNLDSIGISSDKAVAGNIDTSRVNVLSFDKNKFLDAFDSDLASVKYLLVGNSANNYNGVFTAIEKKITQAMDGGYFVTANKGYDTQISRLNKKIDKAQQAVEVYRARLEAKFASMDLLIANIQNQYSSFLS